MTCDTYLTPGEAADYLRIATSTLAKRRVYGGGPDFTRVGRSFRYRRADLDRWMALSLAQSISSPNSDGDSARGQKFRKPEEV